jgi:hypothetical protein
MSLQGRVSRASSGVPAVRNCTKDEGGPFGFGNQVPNSSHRKLPWSRAMVVSVAETPGQDSGRNGRESAAGGYPTSAFVKYQPFRASCYARAMSSDDHITVRDWRRRPPLPLRVTKKLDIHWCWTKCTRCPHMRAVARHRAPESIGGAWCVTSCASMLILGGNRWSRTPANRVGHSVFACNRLE